MAQSNQQMLRSASELRRRLETIKDPQERAILESDLAAQELSIEAKLESLEENHKKFSDWSENITQNIRNLQHWNSLSSYIREKTGEFMFCLGLLCAMASASIGFVTWVQKPSVPNIVQNAEKFCVSPGKSLVIIKPDGTSITVPESSCVSTIDNPKQPEVDRRTQAVNEAMKTEGKK